MASDQMLFSRWPQQDFSFVKHGGGAFLLFQLRRQGRRCSQVPYDVRVKMPFKQAAQALGAWREGVTLAEGEAIRSCQKEREQLLAAEVQSREVERRQRIEARDQLHAVEALYWEAIVEHDWQLMPELLPRVREAEERYSQLAGLEPI